MSAAHRLYRTAAFRPAPLRVTLVLLAAWLAVTWAVPVSPAWAQIYRWRDADGLLHFSDSPPPDVPVETLEEQGAPSGQRPDSHGSFSQPRQPGRQEQAIAGFLRPGLLWRIEAEGVPPSYLLGTAHTGDPRVMAVMDRVTPLLSRCRTLAVEAVLDASALMELGASLLLTDGSDLSQILDPDLYRRAMAAMEQRGVPEPFAARMKPWVVMSTLSTPPNAGGVVLDLALQARAQAAGIPVVGLETAAEQVAVFESLSRSDQVALLRQVVDQLDRFPAMFEKMLDAYGRDDLNAMLAAAAAYGESGDRQVNIRFMQRINDQRNQKMVQKLVPMLRQGGVMVAVGALHLAGPQGLVARLQAAGFRLQPQR